MRLTILTLFPEFFSSPLKESLIGKSLEKGTFSVEIVNLRSFALDTHKQVDDTPYGGGAGMVLKPDVLASAVKKLKTPESLVILTEPAGTLFKQSLAETLSLEKHLIIICGRYEGVDERFKETYVDLELSVGDYVLNGGEVAALVFLEAIVRLIPGVLGSRQSLQEESFSKQTSLGKEVRLLEYPQYTRPEDFEGKTVPKVLLSGNHQEIEKWRREKALEKTKLRRNDLLKNS